VKYDGHSELLKAAPKRLNDARELLEQPSRNAHQSDAGYRHLCAAHYLAGYAVECALKVYIILLLDSRAARRFARWSDAIDYFGTKGQDLRGKRSHSLAQLRVIAELESEMDADEPMKQAWGICSKWDYNVRYRPDFMANRQSVTQFVEACGTAYDWVSARIPFR